MSENIEEYVKNFKKEYDKMKKGRSNDINNGLTNKN